MTEVKQDQVSATDGDFVFDIIAVIIVEALQV